MNAEEIYAWYAGSAGGISSERLGDALRAAGGFPTQADVDSNTASKKMFSNAEFKALLTKCPAPPKEETAHLFSVFDKTGEGTISSNELSAQVSDLIGKGTISEKELRAVTKDFVSKGKLTYADFVNANLA